MFDRVWINLCERISVNLECLKNCYNDLSDELKKVDLNFLINWGWRREGRSGIVVGDLQWGESLTMFPAGNKA